MYAEMCANDSNGNEMEWYGTKRRTKFNEIFNIFEMKRSEVQKEEKIPQQ